MPPALPEFNRTLCLTGKIRPAHPAGWHLPFPKNLQSIFLLSEYF
jgi:hypothetical protein